MVVLAAAVATTVSTRCHLGWLCVAATSPMPGLSLLQLLSFVSVVVVLFHPPDSDSDADDGDGY